MPKYNIGDVVYHKATLIRCVVLESKNGNMVVVRTAEDKCREYKEEELRGKDE